MKSQLHRTARLVGQCPVDHECVLSEQLVVIGLHLCRVVVEQPLLLLMEQPVVVEQPLLLLMEQPGLHLLCVGLGCAVSRHGRRC